MTDRRKAALERIGRDAELREEIAAMFADDSEAGHAVAARAPLPPVAGTVDVTNVAVASASPAEFGMTVDGEAPPPPPPPGGIGLEAIILRQGRPVLNIKNDDFDPADSGTETWQARLTECHDPLQAMIRSVGRIELRNNPSLDWVGTGWRVADDVIVTNRHVAQVFAHRDGDGFRFAAAFPEGSMQAAIDFREEHEGAGPAEFELVEVLHIEDSPGPDLAFFRVDWTSGSDPDNRDIIRLGSDPVVDQRVVVIGYPAKDSRTRMPDDMDRIFGHIYNVKRLAPGEVDMVYPAQAAFAHDATTLGGNSGSVVLDMDTGAAVGLHFAGKEESANYAVLASEVHRRLDRALRRRPVTAAPESAVMSPEELAGRSGYDPQFLGVEVALPCLSPEVEATVPDVVGTDTGLLDYIHYSVLMNKDRRLATYTACNIDGLNARNVRRGRDRWSLDGRLAEEFQVGNELYRRNKLDRGHLVRRLDPAWGETLDEAAAGSEDTFFYTNAAPQHERLNQRSWLGLEDYILGNADVHDLKVNVFTGPVFREDDRRYRDFAVPDDFWKVVAMVRDDTNELSVTAYMLTQRDFLDDLEFVFAEHETFQVSVAEVERKTGLDFGSLKDHDPLATRESRAFVPLTELEQIVL